MEKSMEKNIENEIEIRVNQEIEKRLRNPEYVIEAYQKSLLKAKKEISELKPKAEFYDIVAGSNTLVEMSRACKIISFKDMGRNNMFRFLESLKILRYNNDPYQKYIDAGYFKIIEQRYSANGETRINSKTMVTQKGINYIIKKLLENGYVANDK